MGFAPVRLALARLTMGETVLRSDADGVEAFPELVCVDYNVTLLRTIRESDVLFLAAGRLLVFRR